VGAEHGAEGLRVRDDADDQPPDAAAEVQLVGRNPATSAPGPARDLLRDHELAVVLLGQALVR